MMSDKDKFIANDATILAKLQAILSEYFIEVESLTDLSNDLTYSHRYQASNRLYGERFACLVEIAALEFEMAVFDIIPFKARLIIDKLIPKVKP